MRLRVRFSVLAVVAFVCWLLPRFVSQPVSFDVAYASDQPYFCEVLCTSHTRALGSTYGYDCRYYTHCGSPSDVSVELVQLYTAFATFAAEFRLVYWLAHGSLLGWYWQRSALPWDVDIDLHVVYEQLVSLPELNHTVYVYDDVQFMFDVNPALTVLPDQSNRIDARFISLATGKYIDVTAVEDHHGVLCARDTHCYKYIDVYPLVRTQFNGQLAFVPLRARDILVHEYGYLSVVWPWFHWHRYDRLAHVFVPAR